MITVVSTSLHVDLKLHGEDEHKEYADALFTTTESIVLELLPELEKEIHVILTEASLKIQTKIGIVIGLLYQAICSYGAFWQGLDTINRQCKQVAATINERQIQRLKLDKEKIFRQRGTSGALGRLKRVMDRVEHGELTAKEGMEIAQKLFPTPEASSAEPFFHDLDKSFRAYEKLSRERRPPSQHLQVLETPETIEQLPGRRRGILRGGPGVKSLSLTLGLTPANIAPWRALYVSSMRMPATT
jgi:hypothetical protein